jgi:hypothetical protein
MIAIQISILIIQCPIYKRRRTNTIYMCAKDNKKKHLRMQLKPFAKTLKSDRKSNFARYLRKKRCRNVAKTLCMFLLSICDHRLQHIQSHTLQNSIVPAKDSKRIATTLSPCLCYCPSSLSFFLGCVLVSICNLDALNCTLRTPLESQQTPNTLPQLSLCASPSLFLSLFLLLINLRPQRIEPHSL